MTEHQIQAAFFTWAHLARKAYPVLGLLFAVPNGGVRNIQTARKLKAEGVEPGIPDVLFAVPRQGYNGLAIEFKVPGGKPSSSQTEKIDLLRSEGWRVEVMTDWFEAKKLVKWYLGV